MDAHGVWEAVQPEDDEIVDVKKDKMARAYLLQMLPEDILLQVAQKKTAKDLWDCLKTRFVGAARVRMARLSTLKGEFDALRMNGEESLDEYAGKLSGMSVRYANLGGMLDDAELVKKLLNTIPDRYYPVVAGIEQFCDLETMPFEEAVGRLKTFEERARLRAPNNNSDGQLLLTQAEWQARQKSGNHDWGGRGGGGGRDRGSRSSPQCKEGASGSGNCGRDKSHIKCFSCNKMGHYASECRNKSRAEETNLSYIEEDEEPVLLLSACVKTSNLTLLSEEKVKPQLQTANDDHTSDVWYFDNGASNHMSGERKKFYDMNESIQGQVRFSDGSDAPPTGYT